MQKRSIAHLEIPAADRKQSGSFYADAFGWDINHREEAPQYTSFQSSNVRGGFSTFEADGAKPGDVIVYIESDDVEADLRRVEALGGKALGEPVVIPGVGVYTYFTDPAGNRLGLWKRNQPQG